MPENLCEVTDCKSPRNKGRRICRQHRYRLEKYGSVDAPLTRFRNLEDRLNYRTEKRGECLIWSGRVNRGGYPVTTYNGKTSYVYRLTWARARGTIPDGMQVDHVCHNRSCVRVEHLRLASHSENSRNRSGPHLAVTATGVRNVHVAGKKYAVRIKKHGKLHYFGVYSTIEEAARVAERERAQLFGDFAGLG